VDSGLVVVERWRVDLVRRVLGSSNAARSRLVQGEFLPRSRSRTVPRRSPALTTPSATGTRMCLEYSTDLSLSPRGTSEGGRGGGRPRLTFGDTASSPRPSPPAGEEREKTQQCNAKHIRALCVRRPRATPSSIMKIKQLLVSFAALCAIATVVGCASTDRQASQSSFDVMSLNRDRKPFSQQVNLNQLVFEEPDLATNGAVTLEEWQRLDTSAGARENFSALDERGDDPINLTEFLKQATKHSKRYHFFADTETINEGYVSWDKELFHQPGWQLFSIQF